MMNLLIVVGAVILVVAVAAYIRVAARNAEIALKYRDDFYTNAEKLAEAPDDVVPLSVIRALREIGGFAQSRLVPVVFVLRSWFGARNRKSESDTLWADIDSMNPAMQKILSEAMIGYILAMTFNNVIIGPIMRRKIMARFNRQNGKDGRETTKIAMAMSSACSWHHGAKAAW